MRGKNRTRAQVFHLILAAVVLAFITPVLAHANSVTINNHDGNAGTSGLGSMGPFTLTGSEVTLINGLPVSDTLSFTTGAFITGSGNLSGVGMTVGSVAAQWSSVGSSFTIMHGKTGVIFTGTFTGTISWLFEGCGTAMGVTSCNYTLTGAITGSYMGHTVTGSTVQLDLTSSGGSGYYNGGFGKGFLKDTGGVTTIVTPTAEPASLALMGTGLLGIAFATRRKIKGQSDQDRDKDQDKDS